VGGEGLLEGLSQTTNWLEEGEVAGDPPPEPQIGLGGNLYWSGDSQGNSPASIDSGSMDGGVDGGDVDSRMVEIRWWWW
jgi:hypothetical protein